MSERVHNCHCGCTLDRDVAAAQVMLNYALGLGTSLYNRGEGSSTLVPTNCGGFKQLASLRRQKQLAQSSDG